MKALSYHGKCTDGEGIVVASLCRANKMHQIHTLGVKQYHYLSCSVCQLRCSPVPFFPGKKANLVITLPIPKALFFFKYIIRRSNDMALNKPTPLNSFFRVNQVGLSLRKKCLPWFQKTPSSFQQFLSPAARTTVIDSQQ